MYRRFLIAVLLLIIGMGLVLIVMRSTHTRSCRVWISGISSADSLRVQYSQRTVKVQSSCRNLKISGFGISGPLSGRLVSESVPGEILISTGMEEGLGCLKVQVADSGGGLVYSATIPVWVHRYPLYEPKMQYAGLYKLPKERILRITLISDQPSWKFVQPHTVYLWLLDREWNLLNHKFIQLKRVIDDSGVRSFCAQFSENAWTFDFVLPTLRRVPAYALIVGGGRRGQPEEFNFQALISWHGVKDEPRRYLPLQPYPFIGSDAHKLTCRWRWWYGERLITEKAHPPDSLTLQGSYLILPRYTYLRAESGRPFRWLSSRVGQLIIWHEAPQSCKPSLNCFMGVNYSLSEEWNEGRIRFSDAERRQIIRKGFGTGTSLSPMEYQIFYGVSIAPYSGGVQPKPYEVQFAGCSHPHLQNISGTNSPPLNKLRLPPILPIRHAYIGGGWPLGTLLGTVSSDHKWVYQADSWLSIRTEVNRLYYFAIPNGSNLSKLVFNEDSSIRYTLITKCKDFPATLIICSLDSL